MDFFTCTSACRPSDPVSDTVQFDASMLAKGGLQQPGHPQCEEEGLALQRAAEERAAAEEQEHQRQLEEQQEEQRRLEEERLRQESEERRRLEAEAERQERARLEQEERERREEAERVAAELLRQQQERAAAEEARRQEEAARAERERRKLAVAGFLKEQGFAGGVRGPKRNLVNTTYPLHRAAKLSNAQMVQWLLAEGADASQKNSAGRTAAEVARRHNEKASHQGVLTALQSGIAARAGGA